MGVLGVWDTWGGGHWGNRGPELAASNAFGGVNMIVTENGGVAPMSASRELVIDNVETGQVYGEFWAWGADGNVYYLQDGPSSAPTTTTSSRATVFSFTPTPGASVSQTDVGGVTGPVVYQPDWLAIGTTVLVSVYGDKTYTVDTTNHTMARLTGTYGNAAAGRCIALYGERIVVGGVSDARFGTHPNRIHFSGDDTGNDPTLETAWESLNYFDLGADGTPITGLYPVRDHLVVVLEDQQVYLITGNTPSVWTARRVYGFHKGSGAVTSFVANNAAVDPDQSRVWLFDHTLRSPATLTGVTYNQVDNWGSPHADRTASDIQEGTMTMVGAPNEFVMYGVAASRSAGEGVVDSRLELVRVNGAYGLGQRSVIGLREEQF